MIGYSGSGYKGMQLQVPMKLNIFPSLALILTSNHHEKTIEGDLFRAFVAAGAISKANADDPRKSSLVRCARTDKGVHAAGNLISLKLIIEDQEIVRKINENLTPQIRVFGIERTNGSFSAYQICDSRIYEYLIPTHAFVPPHPKSFLGKKLSELAEEFNDTEGFQKRQSEVSGFWDEAENLYIKPLLDRLDPSTRSLILKILYESDVEDNSHEGLTQSVNPEESLGQELSQKLESGTDLDEKSTQENQDLLANPKANGHTLKAEGAVQKETDAVKIPSSSETGIQNQVLIEPIVRQLRAAYIAAKKAHRINPERLTRVKSVLSHFVGPQNFHNYTVHKNFLDASANRVIKSFVVHKDPIIINDTEWLSLKVHGQSFMMHQIRKMVSMAALVVRCGCPEERLKDSYTRERISIPKAPGLGLLLERPVFDTYNERFAGQRESLDFVKYEAEMEEFKQREIYERIFREEERDHQFVLTLLILPE